MEIRHLRWLIFDQELSGCARAQFNGSSGSRSVRGTGRMTLLEAISVTDQRVIKPDVRLAK